MLELLNAVRIASTAVDLAVLRAPVVIDFKCIVFFILYFCIFRRIYFSDRKLGFEVLLRQTPVLPSPALKLEVLG